MFKATSFGKILIGIGLIAAVSACETMQNEGSKRAVHLDDGVVTAKVREALAKDPALQKYTIDVQTMGGEVVLRGRVDSVQDVYRAAEVVHKVEGVQSLLNDLSEK
jgi:hyperosmotically inducible protein